MKTLIILWGTCAFAQLTLSTTTPSPRPGDTVTVMVNVPANLGSVSWTAQPPQGITLTAAAGSKVNAFSTQPLTLPAGAPQGTPVPGKTLICTSSGLTCNVIGYNTTVIPAGDVAQYRFTVAPTAAPGPITLNLTNAAGALTTCPSTPCDLNAKIPATASLTVTVQARQFDLNKDGKVDLTDINVALQAALGNASCDAAADPSGDGVCNSVDVFGVIFAILQGAIGG